MTRFLRAIFCLAAFGLFVGCQDKPEVRTVAGTVSFGGKPVDHGLITFQPGTGRPLGAPIQPDGQYSVEIAPGDYSVTIVSPPKLPVGFKEGDPLPPPDPNPLPDKYGRRETSGLSATVEAGSGNQSIDFSLQ